MRRASTRSGMRTCHELGRRSAVAGIACAVSITAVLGAGRGMSCAAVEVALSGVEVCGDMVCPLLRPCAGSWRGCVELLDADELDGVGEDGHEGVHG